MSATAARVAASPAVDRALPAALLRQERLWVVKLGSTCATVPRKAAVRKLRVVGQARQKHWMWMLEDHTSARTHPAVWQELNKGTKLGAYLAGSRVASGAARKLLGN